VIHDRMGSSTTVAPIDKDQHASAVSTPDDRYLNGSNVPKRLCVCKANHIETPMAWIRVSSGPGETTLTRSPSIVPANVAEEVLEAPGDSQMLYVYFVGCRGRGDGAWWISQYPAKANRHPGGPHQHQGHGHTPLSLPLSPKSRLIRTSMYGVRL
jgi:hypothetical protein